jgi:hypothetical protein
MAGWRDAPSYPRSATNGDNQLNQDLAWAVGLYEGEGTACTTKTAKQNSGRVIVALGMCDREPVERFHQIIGLGRVEVQYQGHSYRKVQYRWTVTRSDEVIQVLSMLIDSGYLSPRRLEQAQEVLERARQVRPTRNKKKDLDLLVSLGLKKVMLPVSDQGATNE